MANHSHIHLEGFAREVNFESSSYPRSELIERNATVHSQALREDYHSALESFRQGRSILQGVVDPVDGSYINFQVVRASMVEGALDTATGAQLMNIRSIEGNDEEEQVTLFLPQDRSSWFTNKLNEYDREPDAIDNTNGETQTIRRRNQKLVNAVSCISNVDLKDFFSSRSDLDTVQDGASRLIEVWFAEDLYEEEIVRSKLTSLGIEYGIETLVFHQVVILLVKSNAQQLLQIVHALPGITEFRLYRDPSILLNADEIEKEEWMRLIQEDVIVARAPLERIAILDTGVNPHHRLLSSYLPPSRCFSVIASGNTRDQENHGTGLASLALYGDLTDVIYSNRRVKITSDLTSVKMLSLQPGERNRPKMYALITEDAIHTGRDSGARILCSAVTDRDHPVLDAVASSTSAAVDETLYNDGACDSVFLISAGDVFRTGGLPYPDYLFINSIQDPAQAWNAITVGAYTQKAAISDSRYQNSSVLAPAGGISPFSCTSVQWGANAIKPEIMMEGGNSVLGIGDSLDRPDDLSLVVAHAGDGLAAGEFHTSNATSAAVGLAARLASKIQYYNPRINALTVRALLIHSAEWTSEMKALFQNSRGETDVKMLLHSCGYGVPNERNAIASSDSRVTFISEDVLRPFVMGAGGKIKFGHMNLYHMPWPKTLLESLETQMVRLKVTLSYYIKPSPGIRSRLNKYSYQSIRLKFDVCGPRETQREFENRIKRLSEGGENRLRNPELSRRWTIGMNNRNQGSICSDSFEMTGVDMSACDIIAVYPSGGWLRNYPEYLDIEIPYSLVVTLETQSEEILLYNEVETTIANSVSVPIGV